MEVLAPDGTHPKNYFLKNNGLGRILYDLNFSVLQKYRCFANCKKCYTKDFWIPSSQVKNFISSSVASGIQRQWFEIFNYFEMVSIIDDLKFIKDEAPHLWPFYINHQDVFYLSSLNDNAIIRHLPILTKEFFPKGIHEVCLSEEFILRQGIAVIIKMLIEIHVRVPIQKIVFYRLPSEAMGVEAELSHWCADNGVSFQCNYSVEESVSQSLASRSQSLFLMYDQFYIDLKMATTASGKPFASLENFAPVSFLPIVLHARRDSLALVGKHSEHQYYSYIRQHLNIYDGYNFIPMPVLPTFTKYYRALVSKGLAVETKYGLLVVENQNLGGIKPLIDFKDKE